MPWPPRTSRSSLDPHVRKQLHHLLVAGSVALLWACSADCGGSRAGCEAASATLVFDPPILGDEIQVSIAEGNFAGARNATGTCAIEPGVYEQEGEVFADCNHMRALAGPGGQGVAGLTWNLRESATPHVTVVSDSTTVVDTTVQVTLHNEGGTCRNCCPCIRVDPVIVSTDQSR